MTDENQKPAGDSPEIHVDESWKKQVEAEKNAARQAKLDGKTDDSPQLPPATFETLVSSLATQALACLGAIPDPVEQKPVVRKPLARHFIDSIAMLEEKTRGNLEKDEAELVQGALHQLRMMYIEVPDAPPEEPEKKSKIIL